MTTVTALGDNRTNGAETEIATGLPYQVTATLEGTSDMLFHRWNCEAVAEKSKAKKGSAAKKSDNIESYVYRMDDETLALPGEYVRGALITAAKYRQDPRSPRKSAMDLYKAGVVSTTPLASLGKPTWDYEHAARVVIQRSGITRIRPALKAGWRAQVGMLVLTPEYISPADLQDVLVNAGRLVGVGDFRPTYGRFAVVAFEMDFGKC